MLYSRCKCGKCESWNSGMPDSPCNICDECGSTLSGHPDFHREPEPHQYELWYNQRTGEKDYYRCKRCYKKVKIEEVENANI